MAVEQAAFVSGNPICLLKVFNRHFKLRKSKGMRDMKRGDDKKEWRGWDVWGGNRGEHTHKKEKEISLLAAAGF